jgi:spermidine synthase
VRGKKLYDLIYCDVFNAFSIPAHLTTREFDEKVAEILSPDGFYLVNLIDIFDSGMFLNECLNTLRAVFPRVAVYQPVFSGGTDRTTYVIVAGRRAYTDDMLLDAEGAAVGTLVPESRLAELAARNGPGLLTDDHAPVENLIAPIFVRNVQ